MSGWKNYVEAISIINQVDIINLNSPQKLIILLEIHLFDRTWSVLFFVKLITAILTHLAYRVNA